jgi:2,3-bisphosphoglycerate-dependent phosphoglycerate mutase
MSLLILLRHGQSMWNQLNVFTGWVNVPLSQQGIDEAISAGKQLAKTRIDKIYTSTLMRAQQTAMIVMAQQASGKVPYLVPNTKETLQKEAIHSPEMLNQMIPTLVDWRLNERFYGKLQGLNKSDTADKFGKEQVNQWRRSYDIAPPEGESLAMTKERTLPCLNELIIPDLEKGLNCLISAHGNSLRSVIMAIEGLSKEAILTREVATGDPLIYRFESNQFHPIVNIDGKKE